MPHLRCAGYLGHPFEKTCFTTSIIMRWSLSCLARLDCGIHPLGSFGSC
jgi:hypothetical protein